MKKAIKTLLIATLAFAALTMSALAAYDDTTGHWAEDSITRWSEYEVVKGRGTSFDPNATMTRAEAAQVFANLLGLNKTTDISAFTDVSSTAWYKDAIAKCVEAGILSGKSATSMDPNGQITREEFLTMFARAVNLKSGESATEAKSTLAKKGFTDTAKVSDWAADSVGTLVAKGYVNGLTATEIAPKENINRASVMALLDQSISTYVGKTVSADEAKTVKAESKGITLIANAATEKVTGTADVVVVAAGAEKVNEETGAIEHNEVRVESATLPVATVAAENVTVTVALGSSTDEATLTVTAVDSEIVYEAGTTAKTVSVEAEGAKVTVQSGAKAESVTVAAEEVEVKVAGTVTEVKVEDTAKNTTIATESTAKIETVENEASNTAVTGTGTVETVESNKDVKVETKTEVKNTGSTEIKVEDKSGNTTEVKTDSTSTESGTTTGGSTGGSTGGGSTTHSHAFAGEEDSTGWYETKVNGVTVYALCKVCATDGIVASSDQKEYNVVLSEDLDADYPIYIAPGQTVTIDLNGHNIIAEGCDAIYNRGNLTVKSDGFVYPQIVNSDGEIIFNTNDAAGCIIVDGGEAVNGIVNSGTLTVKECTIAVNDIYGSAIVNKADGSIKDKVGTTTVENACLLSTGLGNCVYNVDGTTNLNAGTVALSATYGFAALAYDGVINVNAGSYYSLVGFSFCICNEGTINLNARTMETRTTGDYSIVEADGAAGEVYWLAGTLSTVAAQQAEDISVIATLEGEPVEVDKQTQSYVEYFNSLAD